MTRAGAPDSPLDLLAIGAHPDDVEISCGGMIAVAASQGLAVGILDLTRGELGTNGTPEIRAAEAAEAARLLGVARRWNAELPDGAVSAGDRAQERRLVEILRRTRPSVILSHYPKDRHPDHVQASLLVERAWYLSGLKQYDASGDAFRPSGRYWFSSRIGFTPSLIVDITAVWDRKRAAIEAHRTQVSRVGSGAVPTALNEPDVLERFEARARHFGGMIGVRYGEPLASDLPIGLRELSVLLGAPRPSPSAFTG